MRRLFTERGQIMDPKTYRLPLDAAHQILATFGITRSTRAYERWVKEDGFDLEDFECVLSESPFMITADWRSSLGEVLEDVMNSLDRRAVHLQIELNGDEASGYISLGSNRRVSVSYGTSDDDFDEVFRSLQSIVAPDLEFRSSAWNGGSDTSQYAVLSRGEWADLETVVPEVINHYFMPLPESLRELPRSTFGRVKHRIFRCVALVQSSMGRMLRQSGPGR